MHHDKASEAQLPRHAPDRVYGLRNSGILSHAIDQFGGDPCTFSPFGNAEDPLLLPFLILEAKAEKSCDSWDSIEKQTALPIMRLLQQQIRLQQIHEPRLEWEDGPLVWFLANRGNDWRLYAAYSDAKEEETNYVRHPSDLCSL